MSGTSNVPASPGMSGNSLFRFDVFDRMRQARNERPESPLSDFFAFAPLRDLTALIGDQAEVIDAQVVSGGYYAGLGVQPILGRAIADEDDKPGVTPVVMLSHQFWQERFGASAAVIGQPLRLNNQSCTIIGVLPTNFIDPAQVDFHPVVTVPLNSEPLLRGERSRLGSAQKGGWLPAGYLRGARRKSIRWWRLDTNNKKD